MTLIATPGPSANSYATVAEADAYFANRGLFTGVWTNASVPNKESALIWGTRLLDIHFDWVGYRRKRLEEQSLRWPRSGVSDLDGENIDPDIIPQFLKEGLAECAKALLSSDRTAEPDTKGFSSIKVDVIELEIDKGDVLDVIPINVFEDLSAYGTRRHSRGGSMVTRIARS